MLLIRKLISKYKKLTKNTKAATAVEYALLAGGIGIALIAALGAFKGQLSTALSNIGSSVISTSTSG